MAEKPDGDKPKKKRGRPPGSTSGGPKAQPQGQLEEILIRDNKTIAAVEEWKDADDYIEVVPDHRDDAELDARRRRLRFERSRGVPSK